MEYKQVHIFGYILTHTWRGIMAYHEIALHRVLMITVVVVDLAQTVMTQQFLGARMELHGDPVYNNNVNIITRSNWESSMLRRNLGSFVSRQSVRNFNNQ